MRGGHNNTDSKVLMVRITIIFLNILFWCCYGLVTTIILNGSSCSLSWLRLIQGITYSKILFFVSMLAASCFPSEGMKRFLKILQMFYMLFIVILYVFSVILLITDAPKCPAVLVYITTWIIYNAIFFSCMAFMFPILFRFLSVRNENEKSKSLAEKLSITQLEESLEDNKKSKTFVIINSHAKNKDIKVMSEEDKFLILSRI